jgi:CO dehydrogenase/acetyl-CoA synthase alpha subunit
MAEHGQDSSFYDDKASQLRPIVQQILKQTQLRNPDLTYKQKMEKVRHYYEIIDTLLGDEPDEYYDTYRQKSVKPSQQLQKLWKRVDHILTNISEENAPIKALKSLSQLRDKLYQRTKQLYNSKHSR